MRIPFRLTYFLMTVAAFFFFYYSLAVAQTEQTRFSPQLQRSSSKANYYYAESNELTILVNIWGFVQQSGRYEVSSSTNLVELLSLAGGPKESANLKKIKITRQIKTESGIEKKEFIINLENLTTLNKDQLRLYPGDTIFVDHTSWYTIKYVIDTVSTLAVICASVAVLINVL